ncbi:MAG TPA: hypothetical protein VGD27_05190 [Longimicrobiales bacterium]
MRILLTCALLLAVAGEVRAQQPPRPATRAVFIDREGVIRWRDTRQEVALYGANYTLPSASDFRAAGYLKLDRKKLVEEDMAHFARMGWDALRLSFWGDWENSDRAGNLVENEHLDLQDYLIAQARARGIYILFSPITTYNANWPDELQDTTDPGFSKYYDRGKLGTDSAAWAAQVNYIRQLLEHVNPYTGTKLKDEPAILFVEPVNEPWHRSEDIPLSIRYINALSDAIRSTGSKQLIFYNVSQDFRISDAIRAAKVEGVTFGWYPTGLNSGRELQGNYLRSVDHFDPMQDARIKHLPRIVYEFDSPDLRTGYMYPAMARTMRAVGAQFAAMFAYDMLRTSSRNLGWQTHYLNLVYTPRKAISSVIAAEAMRRLPRMRNYGPYPANTRFGDFRISYENNSSELLAADAFMHAGNTANAPPDLKRLQRIAAYGSSPLIEYEGEGVYFVDKLGAGVWRLELYPDAVPVRDPFEMPNADKIVTRALYRAWPMRIQLPDLGSSFTIQPLSEGNAAPVGRAQDGRFTITPGVYLLSARGAVAASTLPAFVGHVGLKEFHAPAPDSMPLRVTLPTPEREYVSGTAAEISARVVATTSPDSVTLFLRPVGRGWFNRYPMEQQAGYDYRARIPADSLRAGPYQYVISVTQDGRSTTFPEGIERRPWDWDFSVRELWTVQVVSPTTPLRLLSPAADAPVMHFTRIGDAGRTGIFRVTTSEVTGEPALHLELPVMNDWSPDDYTASLVIKERIRARAPASAQPKSVKVRVRGVGARQVVHITLVERDGTSWSAPIEVDATWSERVIPLGDFVVARSVLLPQGFPGQWSYWVGAAQGRGGAGDVMRWREMERLQLSLRRPEEVRVSAGSYGVEIESVLLVF